jgi:hypothetical protein
VQAPKILAALFVVLGVGFIAWGLAWRGDDLLATAGTIMIGTGVVFFAVAGLMMLLSQRLRGAKRARNELTSTGIPGEATILSIRETGISFRSGLEVLVGFELEVRVPGRSPYNVALEQGVPRLLLGGVLPGSVVSVRVDPAGPNEVAIDFSAAPRPGGMPSVGVPGGPGVPGVPGVPVAGVPGATGAPLAGPPGTPPIGAVKTASELLASGVRGQATVVAAQDLGMTVAQTGRQPERPEWLDDRIFLFTLEVHLDGQAPYTAQVGHRVPDDMAAQIRPGMTLPVAVDPATPALSVAIDWGGR